MLALKVLAFAAYQTFKAITGRRDNTSEAYLDAIRDSNDAVSVAQWSSEVIRRSEER